MYIKQRRSYMLPRTLILVVYGCFVMRGLFYCAALPDWEGYDEWSHFAVIQRMALRGELLVSRSAPISREVESALRVAPLPWELRHYPPPFKTHDDYWRLNSEERRQRQAEFYSAAGTRETLSRSC